MTKIFNAPRPATADDVRAALEGINETVAELRDDIVARVAALEKEGADRARADALAGIHIPSGSDFLSGADADIFAAYIRKGLVSGAMSTDSSPDGGYLVPTQVERAITSLVRNNGALRRVAGHVECNTDSYTKVVNLGGANGLWVGEREARPQTNGVKLSELEFLTHELSAMPPVTQKLIDDSRVDVAAMLTEAISNEFLDMEGDAFIRGNGVKKPKGLLSYPIVDNASWAWGKIGFVKSGDANGFIAATTSASPADCLVDLVYSLKAGYRTNAGFLMTSKTAMVVRKMKDADGRFLWQDSITEGQPARLLGYPVHIDDFMDEIGAGLHPIAFADFRRAYLIVDRTGTRILRDPYSTKPYVLFYCTKRVGGGVQNFDAVKLLKIAA